MGIRAVAAWAVLFCWAVAGHGAEAPARFDVSEYRVTGNTVLETRAVERAVYPFLGPERSIDDVDGARAALEKAYHDAGYLTVVVNLPEQQVHGGTVRLEVLSGEVDRLRISGARYYSLGRIRERVPALAQGQTPHFPTVQAQLATLSGNPDRKVTPVLRPGRSPGKVEVDLNVEDKLPLHASVTLNDRYSANTARLRTSASVRYANLWQREHALSMQAITAPQEPDDATVFSATYVLPFGGGGRVLALYGVTSESDVAAVGDVSVIGNGDIWGARYVIPLPGRRSFFHTATLGVDHKRFGETVVLQGADSFSTPISYTPFMAEYQGTLRDDAGDWRLAAGAYLAPRGVLGNGEGEFANKRFGAGSNYAYLKLGLAREQKLPFGFTLAAGADGQYAGQPLISNEQYGAGGAQSVRGYLEAEELGDNAVRAGLELRTGAYRQQPWLDELIGLVFLEGASLWIEDPLPAQRTRFHLAGTGMGLRMRVAQHLAGTLDLARALKDASETAAGDWRMHFGVEYAF